MFFKVNLEFDSFSAHHLLASFTPKSSLTVTELRDYITRRKNKKSQNSNKVKNGCTNSRVRIGRLYPPNNTGTTGFSNIPMAMGS